MSVLSGLTAAKKAYIFLTAFIVIKKKVKREHHNCSLHSETMHLESGFVIKLGNLAFSSFPFFHSKVILMLQRGGTKSQVDV